MKRVASTSTSNEMKRVASTSTMREDASRCNFTANVKPDLLHTRVNASNTPDKAFENKAHK